MNTKSSAIVGWMILNMVCISDAQTKTYVTKDGIRFRVETVLEGLEVPWAIAFDHSGAMYFTERGGNVKMWREGWKEPKVLGTISEVLHRGEGGLMSVEVHPDFEKNGYLYFSYTYRKGLGSGNKVVRYRLSGDRITEKVDILEGLPGSSVHNGCRVRFGPDGKLYITTGDAASWDIAQDLQSLGGKILRLNDDGSIPADNPFPGSRVWALGVRNPQGIAWHLPSKTMFEVEHGPSGFEGRGGGGDELNFIERGKNYGWPVIHHREEREGMESPLAEYSPALAPGGVAVYAGKAFPGFDGNIFIGGLRGERIQRLVWEAGAKPKILKEEELLRGEFGRIREVTVGPDGLVYFTTSNRDGRGKPKETDDRILRIRPTR